MGKALYRKYRSTSLSEVLGQAHITDVLTRAIAANKIAHAYLLTGPRGVGKTSIARILAHEINQLPYDGTEHLDIIEIDAASNNGVDDVRDLREKVRLAPVSAQKKIYIIDEVHMLSKPAFNALLKTLEEPPEHVVFILATTDAEKLPDTIKSRTQTYQFRSITKEDVAAHLRTIADKEKIVITDEALLAIAEHGRGSFRDSIGMLDQLGSSSQEVTLTTVETVLGLAPSEFIDSLLAIYHSGDFASANRKVRELEERGLNPSVVASQLATVCRENLAKTPELLALLQKLPEVAKSSMPAVSLLLALSSNVKSAFSSPSSTPTASHPTPIEHLSVSIGSADVSSDEVAGNSVVTQVQSSRLSATPEGDKSIAKSAPPAKSNETLSATPLEDIGSQKGYEEEKGKTEQKPKKKTTKTKPPKDFPWADFVAHVKTQSVPLYSLIEKRGHEFDGETLTVYAVNAFNKKKLDDKRYAKIWHSSLEQVGLGEIVINTVPTHSPPSDPALAKVAAMMGGGEEVSL